MQGNILTPTVSGVRIWQQVFAWWAQPITPIPAVSMTQAGTTILGTYSHAARICDACCYCSYHTCSYCQHVSGEHRF